MHQTEPSPARRRELFRDPLPGTSQIPTDFLVRPRTNLRAEVAPTYATKRDLLTCTGMRHGIILFLCSAIASVATAEEIKHRWVCVDNGANRKQKGDAAL